MNAESYNKKIKKALIVLVVFAMVMGFMISYIQETMKNVNWIIYLFAAVIAISVYFIIKTVIAREQMRDRETEAIFKKNGFVPITDEFSKIDQLKQYEIKQSYHKEINGIEVLAYSLILCPFRNDPGSPALFFKINKSPGFGKVLITLPNSATSRYINSTWLNGLSKVEFETSISGRLVLAENNSQELWQFFDPLFLEKLEKMPVQTDLFADASCIGLLLWDYRTEPFALIQLLLETIIKKT